MDLSSEEGAQELADRIRQHWIDRGYPAIKTQVVYVRGGNKDGRGGVPVWGVRSNIEPSGYPPKGAVRNLAARRADVPHIRP